MFYVVVALVFPMKAGFFHFNVLTAIMNSKQKRNSMRSFTTLATFTILGSEEFGSQSESLKCEDDQLKVQSEARTFRNSRDSRENSELLF